jgi:hypothetical protein
MKTIMLSKGGETFVDDSDFAWLAHWKWKLHPQGYASRTTRSGTVLMHRSIMGEPDGDVDHRNRNKLDNRRRNLRLATRSQNMHNRGVQSNSRSGIKGVCWDPKRKKWRATIQVDGRYRQIGRFETREAASMAYRAMSARLVGEFAAREESVSA